MLNSTLSVTLYFIYGVTAIFLIAAVFKIFAIFSILQTKKMPTTLASVTESGPGENSKIDLQSVYLEILELKKEVKNKNIPRYYSINQPTPQNVSTRQNIRLRRVK